ncbi:MAG TPA: alpha/beta hydrolase [Solirubrobacteraceae bacterium]|nr:alpha/beta hydrolase [Solirubrobacteraceae bacterium]
MSVPEIESVLLGGRRIAWRRLGEGPPLVMVNGYAATSADWDPTLLALLADTHELICLDNRGVGSSELGDQAELSVGAMADDVERVMDAAGLDAAPLLGWSMGGFVVQTVAARVPGRAAAVVLLATDPGGPEATLADPETWARLTDHTGTAREQASRIIHVLFPPAAAAGIDAEFGEIVAAARAELEPATLRAQERAIAAWHEEDPPPLPAMPSPALIVCGSEDVVIPPANTAALAARWPGATASVFPGGGHAFMAQEPGRLAAMIDEFLAGR